MRKDNACSAAAFKEAVEALEIRGYGLVQKPISGRITYTATRAMASQAQLGTFRHGVSTSKVVAAERLSRKKRDRHIFIYFL